MKTFRSLTALVTLAIGLASAAVIAGCGTGVGAADPAASTPASSHFKADLAASYDALQAVDIGTENALQAGAITKAQAQSVATQRKAFKVALDSLSSAGESSSNQTTLTATLAAINAAAAFVAISQGVQK